MLLSVAACAGGEESRARAAGGLGAVSGEPRHETRRPSPSPPPSPPPPRDIDCDQVKCVSLTFDDGPGEHTGRLLDTLKAAGVRATFFMLGEMVREHPDIARRMVLEGHEVANHTWSHQNLTGLSAAGVRSQIERTQKAVKDATGVEPTLMRPPYGATDEHVGRAVGMPQILWSVDTLDWRHRSLARNTKVGVNEPVNGDIVLYHDIHEPTVDSIPKVVEGLKERGFTLVTVTEMFQGEKLEPGVTYTGRADEAAQLAGDPPPSGSPAGPPEAITTESR
ncbi:polysaccharide deacetylase family protein [Actinomadura sp. 6K520]|uniref:polysaccharide deacetylase family protein n=1 Tax=Actinomadura sp. 6K520 TaxID=2530364 RepID=UPI001FB5AD32|nr:polysaccharide deacetylase family protein [Actinomadura sp. 6K520]